MTEYERALMSLDEAKINNLFAAYQQAKAPAFSGGRKFDRGTMGIAAPQDVQFAGQAKEKVAPIAQAVYEGTLADPVERLASWSALADPNTPESVRKAAQDYVAPLPVTPEGRINEEGLSRAAGPMMGVTTYHGSPTSGIRKWDLNFRGTGEGRLPVDSPARESFKDMIGHGLYSAEKEGIAKGYQERLAKNNLKDLSEAFSQSFPGGEAIIDRIHYPNAKSLSEAVEKGYVDASKLPFPFRNALSKGALYTTELTPHPDEFLMWDKPLSGQSEKVKAALENNINISKWEVRPVGEKFGIYQVYDAKLDKKIDWLDGTYDTLAEAKAAARIAQDESISGKGAYLQKSYILGSDKAASEYLHSLGIRGIKYLDNPSRSAGEGTYNDVRFNPAEEAIITHENGQRIPVQ